MDDRKGKSLRKKTGRSQKTIDPKKISAPVPIADTQAIPSHLKPSSHSSRKLDAPRERPQQGDKTADLVKRRYSTKLNQVPQDFNLNAPPVPVLPAQGQYGQTQAAGSSSRQKSSERRRLKADLKFLTDPKYTKEETEKYIDSILAEATADEAEEFAREVQELQRRVDTDLQQSVYDDRAQFIRVSKDAEQLRSEMKTLHNLMLEMTEIIGRANAAAGTYFGASASQKRSNRSSVANLEAMWSSHLQALWKRVQGSQKFLPAIPGRHIVYESGRWTELNVATWKARRRIHIILLNDHLLVATEKKNHDTNNGTSRDATAQFSQGSVQHVAYRCWPIQDVQLADLANQNQSATSVIRDERLKATNAITVHAASESFTFATTSSEANEKDTLLMTFRRTVEELRRHAEDELTRRDSVRRSGAGLSTRQTTTSVHNDALNAKTDKGELKSVIVIDSEGKQRDLRWIEGQFDALDINIALQHFEQAVVSIENLRKLVKNIKNNSTAENFINQELDTKAAKLASSIAKQLVEKHASLKNTQGNVGWLLRLGFDAYARNEYLKARAALIKKRSRRCSFDGDLQSYIFQISFIYFKLIRNTINIYQNSFPSSMASVGVKWAKEQIDSFNEHFKTQMSDTDSKSQLWRDCMEISLKHASMLNEVGLNFSNMIGIIE